VNGRLLVVEDEELIGTMVRMNLEAEGYGVEWVRDGESARKAATTSSWDLVVLDIGLPGADGFDVLTTLRDADVDAPVLMLTARGQVQDKVRALDAGADDYLTKPFDMAELLARVRALVRRAQGDRVLPVGERVRVGSHEVDLESRSASSNEGEVQLTEKEAGVLDALVRASGQPRSRADLLEAVWGMEVSPTERTVDNVIVRLRRLFETDPASPRHIVTVRGVGYRFVG